MALISISACTFVTRFLPWSISAGDGKPIPIRVLLKSTKTVVMRESEESTPCLALAYCLLLKVLSETVQSGLVAASCDSEEHA